MPEFRIICSVSEKLAAEYGLETVADVEIHLEGHPYGSCELQHADCRVVEVEN